MRDTKTAKTIPDMEPMNKFHAQLAADTMQKQLPARLADFRQSLNSMFIERGGVIDGLLTALLARENILLLGPPGTAKSALITTLAASIPGSRCFSRLLTKFSTPEELFGPVSLKGLEEDHYRRVTAGYLPEAHFGFVDEIFKANSAILNSLLTLANERAFDNDGKRVDCPLFTLAGASNELPEGKELEALFDRFMLKYWVGYVTDRDELKKLLLREEQQPQAVLNFEEVEFLQCEAASRKLSDGVIDALLKIKAALESQGIFASDRSWKKFGRILKAYSVVCGDPEVREEHLEILSDCLWREPNQKTVVAAEVGKLANPTFAAVQKLLDSIRETQKKFPGKVDLDALPKASVALDEANKIHSRAAAVITQAGNSSPKLQDALNQIATIRNNMLEQVARAAKVI